MPWPQLPPNRTCRILVVDDHPVNRTLLVRLLSRSGFSLKQAVNGSEAFTLWRQWHPHLILMDIMMPGLNGYKATRLIRATETLAQEPATPIIAISSDHLSTLANKLHTTGFDSIMTKPVRSDILFKLIANHLNLQYDYAPRALAPNAAVVV